MSTVNYYESCAREYADASMGANLDHVYQRFLPALKPEATILDAGCGAGRDMKLFTQLGFKVMGFDKSVELAKIACHHSGQTVHVCSFMEFPAQQKRYDAVWAMASLLHVPRAELVDTMKHLSTGLVPGGRFYLSLKVGEGCRPTRGTIEERYSPEEAKEAIASAGLGLSEFWYTGARQDNLEPVTWMNFIAIKPA